MTSTPTPAVPERDELRGHDDECETKLGHARLLLAEVASPAAGAGEAVTRGRFSMKWTVTPIENGWTLKVVSEAGNELASLWIDADEVADLAAVLAAAAPGTGTGEP